MLKFIQSGLGLEPNSEVWFPSPGPFYKTMLLQILWQSTYDNLGGKETKGQVQTKKTLSKTVLRALLRSKEEAGVRKKDKMPTREEIETRRGGKVRT